MWIQLTSRCNYADWSDTLPLGVAIELVRAPRTAGVLGERYKVTRKIRRHDGTHIKELCEIEIGRFTICSPDNYSIVLVNSEGYKDSPLRQSMKHSFPLGTVVFNRLPIPVTKKTVISSVNGQESTFFEWKTPTDAFSFYEQHLTFLSYDDDSIPFEIQRISRLHFIAAH